MVLVVILIAAGIFIYRRSQPSTERMQKVQDMIKNPAMQKALREEIKKQYEQHP
jgi:preprotein translocase subunit YajC